MRGLLLLMLLLPAVVAAQPVGAQSASLGPLAARIFRIELTSVVLPTPGPPVMTSALERSARRTAAFWLSASVRPVFPSTHGIARSGSIADQGGAPAAKRRSRSAISRSARCRPERNTHRCPSSASATTSPASNPSGSEAVAIASTHTRPLTSSSGEPSTTSPSSTSAIMRTAVGASRRDASRDSRT